MGISNQKMRLLLLMIVFFGTALISCCPPFCIDSDDDCVLHTTVMRQASNGLVYTWDPTSDPNDNNTDWAYISSDMALHRRKPSDLIGYAFEIVHDYRESQDFQLATIFLLQYDLPKQSCEVTIDWKIKPQVQFPNGYLIIPEEGLILDVQLYAFVDPTGQLDIATTNYDVMGQIAENRLEEAINSDNPDITRRWYDDQSNSGPVYVPGVLRGQLTVPANRQGRLFVGASVAISRVSSGESACTGCGIMIDSLLDAGIFRGVAPGSNADDQGLFGPELVITPKS
jgi:hypothetical protein